MQKDLTSAKGVRAIAIFELTKGIFSLVVGIVLLSLLHADLTETAANVLKYLHLDPSGYFAKMFVEGAAQINESNILLFTALAFVYTLVRFIESYGLWRLRTWAEWFAIVSGAIYLPFEIYEIFKKPTVLKFIIFFLNIALVSYLIYVRREANYHRSEKENKSEAL